MSIDLALLVLRVLVGGLFIGHGAQKLFGWFGGHGLKGFAGWLESVGMRPGWLWAFIGAASEFGGGLLLVLGLLNPLGPLAIVAAMLMAIFKFHWSNGLWNTSNGYEYPMVLAIIGGIVGLVGSGRFALDTLLGIALPLPLIFWGGLVVAVLVNGYAILSSNQTASKVGQGKTA